MDSVAVGVVAGYAADRILGDPRRYHPVAGLGRVLGGLERALYRDSRSAGLAHVALAVGGVAVTSALLTGRLRRTEPLLVAAATWAVLGGTTLAAVGEQMADSLDAGDLEAARALIPSLCGRDPNSLDADGMCRAAVESIAENTSDATVAPVLWGAVAGVPGLLAYRTVNTLDAMVGYRSPRYERFGWASARLDDLANFVPARVGGVLAVVLGPDPAASWAAWHRDAHNHPSPNAGVVEASFAGALGIGLGGRTVYAHGVEMRPELGRGHAPGPVDLRAAVRLSRRVQTGAVAVAVGYRVVRAVFSRRSAG
ncbi:cobalamin biosynthesis protein [Gordonia pseudamarae]|jgi:adenosylcobinamide-phosphate synthase|uniref:Cobalamin biosynthesis protein CobD n=1 Tax=Gordonia pseudamarae TaxID=2831662 RepID=A0ABX6IIQ2_9ACTN|nr:MULTISPECIES: cobalamin biosynthesis protein [Gordonia]MBD0022553.1 cobalamin biosynthesis protein [Gordonia sp. (in: high G+C Gram-positive bacteria)]QHN26876.1 cobalamin biosynthesis protein [Gordonia pseudamarae]QHN35767.1 cobalamin biosynthesis protein [Gordonia pseudamarae]